MGRKSGILLIVAGMLLIALPPALYFSPYLLLRQNPLVDDTFYIVLQPHTGPLIMMLLLAALGLTLLGTGIRIVLKAP
jgi:hypothetical protein